MKTIKLITLIFLIAMGNVSNAQNTDLGEKYGNTLNFGVGVGYSGYVGRAMPAIHLDYEIPVAKQFTLAPFVSFLTYRNYYYRGGRNYPYQNYYYRQTVVPVGVKGTYYFDNVLGAGPKWDFYLAASAGFAFRKTVWENGYNGETAVDHGTSGVYLNGHIGTEYHLTRKTGIILDLSTGFSTIGIAIHR